MEDPVDVLRAIAIREATPYVEEAILRVAWARQAYVLRSVHLFSTKHFMGLSASYENAKSALEHARWRLREGAAALAITHAKYAIDYANRVFTYPAEV